MILSLLGFSLAQRCSCSQEMSRAGKGRRNFQGLSWEWFCARMGPAHSMTLRVLYRYYTLTSSVQ